jgi:hypothetical protein
MIIKCDITIINASCLPLAFSIKNSILKHLFVCKDKFYKPFSITKCKGHGGRAWFVMCSESKYRGFLLQRQNVSHFTSSLTPCHAKWTCPSFNMNTNLETKPFINFRGKFQICTYWIANRIYPNILVHQPYATLNAIKTCPSFNINKTIHQF